MNREKRAKRAKQKARVNRLIRAGQLPLVVPRVSMKVRKATELPLEDENNG